MGKGKDEQTFWEHLEDFRGVVLRSLAVALLFGVAAFFFKDLLFEAILAPKDADFVTYRMIERLSVGLGTDAPEPFAVDLINTGLARQFMIHLQAAMCAGVLMASPYILYQLLAYVTPALYEKERKYAVSFAASGYVMFIVGVLLSYFLIFPLTFRFLGTYQVAADVTNLISLESYVSTLVILCLCMGVVFELPVLCALFAGAGLLGSSFMRAYRRHAIVVILVAAAIITPTSDAATLLLVSLPVWILYEGSIFLVGAIERRKSRNLNVTTINS